MEVCQQLQHAELEGDSQPWVIWLEKNDHRIKFVVAGEKGQDVFEVLLVFLDAPTVPNAWSVDKVEPCGVSLKHMFLRKLCGRLTTGENLICIRSKWNVFPFPFVCGKNKPEIKL